MRALEALTAATALVAMGALLIAPQLGGRTPALALTAAAVALAALLHIPGPFRWQMLPAEALILAVVVLLALGAAPQGGVRIAWMLFGLAAASLTVVLATGFPLARLPAPAGPYAVGAATTELVRTGDDGAERRLRIKIWHPADATPGARPEPLWGDLRTPAIPPLPRFFLAYLDGVATHTHAGAPIAAGGPFPLVIYNHGLLSSPSESTLLMEALASEGFIVVAVSHADHVAEHVALHDAIPAEERARDRVLLAAFAAASDRAERARAMADIYANSTGAAENVRRRTADSAFVLDRIETALAAIPGADASAVDRDRVAAVGFSLGGAVATRLCMTDPRCRAAVNIDGGLFGVPDGPLAVPHLMLYAEATDGVNDGLRARATAAFEEETFVGAKHMDFTDATLLWPLLKRLGPLGPAPGSEIVRRRNERVLAFLRAELQGVGR